MSTNILIVDDHEVVRRGLRSLLSSRPELQICGEAADGVEAVEKARLLRPDIVLMDISMPRMDGLEATRLLLRDLPNSRVVIVSQNDPAIVSRQAKEVNASAHIAKSDLARHLLPTLDELIGHSEKQETAPSVEIGTKASILPPWLEGGGPMGKLIGEHDWSKTPLGPIKDWPQSLKTSVNLMLNSQHPMWIGWGPEITFLYNEAYIRVLSSAKHPWALGRPAAEVWSEIWDICGPLAQKVFQKGEASFLDDVRLFMNRGDFLEETYYSFSYSPIRDESGKVGGLFCPSAEVTPKVINARRLATLSELSANALLQRSADSACASAAATLAKNPDDIPFAALYLVDSDKNSGMLRRVSAVPEGIGDLIPFSLKMNASDTRQFAWPLAEVVKTGRSRIVSAKEFEGLPLGPAHQKLSEVIVLPLISRGEDRGFGLLVAAVNPTRYLDAEYSTFFELLGTQVGAAIQNARAAEEERKRIEALAELDRAKTAFFSNVSHEFRTPLTLMLSPVEELLARSHTDLPPAAKRQLELVNRNGTRLLRLVNTLLDFSRIEAGRMQATYQATDLPAFTAELSSLFRSATDKAGLQLELDCPHLAEPVFVDRSMWEKIVLNLLSNAFKFTFQGSITVSLRRAGSEVQLRVRDTGVGIPEKELPRLFERFHRIENTRSRTHEGSGIGLALVQELVKLHSGSIRVESKLGKGTTFIVSLPLGKAHLPAERIGGARSLASTAVGAAPFVEEALRWLPDTASQEPENELPHGHELIAIPCPPVEDGKAESEERPLVLVADDNADMRQYLVHMLSERYAVRAVADGQAALAAIRERAPELVLSDVMMPNLDGFGLLREIRGNPESRTMPVILLSARAGEESRVEGMEQGADDYLIKPFSARELLARVQTHLQMARIRRQTEEMLRRHQERFDLVAQATQVGFWFCDLPFDKLNWDERVKEHFWLLPQAEVTIATFYDRLHPEDRERTRQTIENSIANDTPYDIEYRTVAPDGREKWIRAIGRTFYDPAGQPKSFDGLTMDITERKHAEDRERQITAEALAANAKFRAVFEQTTVFAGIMSQDGILIDANRICLEACGYRADQVLGRPFWETAWWRNFPASRKKIQTATPLAAQGVPYREILRYSWADGTERIMDFALYPIRDHEGKVIFLHPTGVDITDLKRAEEDYRTLADNMSQLAWMADSSGSIFWYNRRFFDYTGTSLEEMQRPGSRKVVHPDYAERVFQKFKRSLAEGEVWEDTFPLRGKDGEYRWFLSRAVPIRDAFGKITRWFGTNTDITELREIEEALRKSKEFTEEQVIARTRELEARNAEAILQSEQVRELSQRLLQIQEDERRHVARELHDSAGQLLTALGMNLARVTERVPPEIAKDAAESQQLVQQLSNEIRTMSYLLHPPLLDESGLLQALRWYTHGLEERSGLSISVEVAEDVGRFSREMELTMFRLVQECLTNIHRHSGSKTATIRIWRDSGDLHLEIRDKGKGIPADRLAQIQAQGSGVGIRGMRERIRQFDGRMQINCNGVGTEVSFKFPLPKAPAAMRKRFDQQLGVSG